MVSLPGEESTAYYRELKYIAAYFNELDKATFGRDHLFIIHDKSGRFYLDKYTFKHAKFIEVTTYVDPWTRDFTPTVPELQVKLKYRPRYLKRSTALRDEKSYEDFALKVDLPQQPYYDIILEGGNIVENGEDKAIITERVFDDNPYMTRDEIANTLEAAINRDIVFVEDPLDTTGHSDGIVSFVEKDVVLLGYYPDHDPTYYDNVERAIKQAFPYVQVVPLPSYEVKKTSWGFASSEGSYANSLVTYNAVYLPFFTNETYNQKALEVFEMHTDKEVVPIRSAGNLAVLGGSIRCLSWQINANHPIAHKLFQFVEYKSNYHQAKKDESQIYYDTK